jgi:hypothetical protein
MPVPRVEPAPPRNTIEYFNGRQAVASFSRGWQCSSPSCLGVLVAVADALEARRCR